MEVNNNSNCNHLLAEMGNTHLINIEQEDLILNALPSEMFEKVLERLNFVGWQKLSCVSKAWNDFSYFSALKLEFSCIRSYVKKDICDSLNNKKMVLEDSVNYWENKIPRDQAKEGFITHLKQQIEKCTQTKDLIEDLKNITSDALNFSIAENPKYLSTNENNITYLEKVKKFIYYHNTKSLMDLELTIHTLMLYVLDIYEKTEFHTFPLLMGQCKSIRSIFKINEFNEQYCLKTNVHINYFKLLAIKNNNIDHALNEIKVNKSFEFFFYSLMSSKRFDLAKPLTSKIENKNITPLVSSLVGSLHLDVVLEWLEAETDSLKKDKIVSGMIQELFSLDHRLSMNVIFETLDLLLSQKFEIHSLVTPDTISNWFTNYRIKESDKIDLAKQLILKIKNANMAPLVSSLVRSEHLDVALEWLEAETDSLKKDDIVSGIVSELFSLTHCLSMNVIFETLNLLLDQKFTIHPFLKPDSLCYWFANFQIKESDNINFAKKVVSRLPEIYKSAMNRALFIDMLKSNPISEVYGSKIAYQMIPDIEIQHKILLEHFFSCSFSYEKTIEIAQFIPANFYFSKEKFLLELEAAEKIGSVLTKYSSPKNYIFYLAKNNQFEEFLTFFDKVPKDVYQEIGEAESFTLMRLVIKLAQNEHKGKARELAEMLPEATADGLIIKYSL